MTQDFDTKTLPHIPAKGVFEDVGTCPISNAKQEKRLSMRAVWEALWNPSKVPRSVRLWAAGPQRSIAKPFALDFIGHVFRGLHRLDGFFVGGVVVRKEQEN